MSATKKENSDKNNSQVRIFGLENLIREAVTLALYEQQPAPAPPPAQPAAPTGSPVPPPAPTPPADQAQPPQQGQDAPAQAQAQQMTIDSMIERLNVIRGGKSFTDPEVYGQLVTYFKKITPEQNQIIDQYLQDISRIMVNVRTGVEPEAEQISAQPPGNAAPPPPATPGGPAQAPISPSAVSPPPAPATPGGV